MSLLAPFQEARRGGGPADGEPDGGEELADRPLRAADGVRARRVDPPLEGANAQWRWERTGAVVLAEPRGQVERWASEAEEAMDRDDDDDDDLDEYEEEYEELDACSTSTSQPYRTRSPRSTSTASASAAATSGRLRLRRAAGPCSAAQRAATGVHGRRRARLLVLGRPAAVRGRRRADAERATRRRRRCARGGRSCGWLVLAAAPGLASGEAVVTLEPLRELFTFDAHADAVSAVHLTTTTLTTGAADGEVAIWRLEEDEGRCAAASASRGTRRPSSPSTPTARRSSRARATARCACGTPKPRSSDSCSRASPRTSARCRPTRAG